MKPARVQDVFTPTSIAKLTFVERESVDARVVRALSTPGKQIVVFGRSGSGKSTLLYNKLFQTYEHHVTTRCVGTMHMDDVFRNAFDQLEPLVLQSASLSRKNTAKQSLAATIRKIRAGIEKTVEEGSQLTFIRALPPQLTPRFLGQLLHEANACWVLEDFHKLEESERQKLAQIMKLFMDLASEFPEVRIVAIGAVATARQIVLLDAEMSNRVSEIEVKLMDDRELLRIVDKGCEALNVSIPGRLADQFVHLSNGLPGVLHQLCLNLCYAAEIHHTSEEEYQFVAQDAGEAVKMFLEDQSDSLKAKYDLAATAERKRTYDNTRLILHALAAFGPTGATRAELLEKIHESEPNYPSGNLTSYLKELTSDKRGSVLWQDPGSGTYSYSDPVLHAYVKLLDAVFEEEHAPRVLAYTGADLFRTWVRLSGKMDSEPDIYEWLTSVDLAYPSQPPVIHFLDDPTESDQGERAIEMRRDEDS